MTILATIIVLGVLIFVHELGHFVAAKWVGIEVQRFSIGLGPKLWAFQRGETEYALSAIPLGGYVKMGGMDDEVMDRIEGGSEEVERTPSPRDFDSKPLWARAFVISAGVIMNMLFAFAAYTFVAGWWGALELTSTRLGDVAVEALPAGAEPLGEIPVGATLESVGGRSVETWGQVQDALLGAPGGPLRITFAEPAGSVELNVSDDDADRRRLVRALSSWAEPVVEAVLPGAPAEKAGIEAGDRVLAVDGQPVTTWWEFVDAIEARPGERTELQLEREGSRITRVATLDSEVETDPLTGEERTVGKVGIYPSIGETSYRPVDAVTAVRMGWDQTVLTTGSILGFLRDLVTGGVPARSVGSIVTIGEASGQAAQAGMDTFLRFMALFSINLAVLNLLPIPVLDGGHLLFLTIEGVRGKALTVEQRLRWSNVGFLVVVGIMIWALSNDFMRLLGL